MDQATRDSHWAELNKLSTDYIASGGYAAYTIVRYTMVLQLLYEQHYVDSFTMFAEVFLWGLNGMDTPYYSSRLIDIAKRIYPCLPVSRMKLNKILSDQIKAQATPFHFYSVQEVQKMFMLLVTDRRDAAANIFMGGLPDVKKWLQRSKKETEYDLKIQDTQLQQVQAADAKYKESKNLEEYVDFWENVWLGGGLLFYSSKWWFVLPDLYFKQKRFDEVIEFCTMIKFLDDYASDKADKYILRAQQRKEKQLAKNIKTNV